MAVNEFYLGTFIVYLLIVLGIGAWGYTKTTDVADFWVYGKRLGPWLATWSYVANFVSAVSVIGFIGSVYGGGYSILTGIVLGLMLGISALYFVVHKVRELDHVTFPDIIRDLTGREIARPIAAVPLLANAWVYLIMQLVGASLLVTTITGVPYRYMIWVIGFVFVAYTVMGGLVSVAWTDLIQGTVMVTTVLAALVFIIIDQGSLAAINTQFTQLSAANTMPLGDGAYTLLGLAGSLVAFFGTIFTAQGTIIRINATKDIRTAKIHLAFGGLILSVFYSALILLGGGVTVALNNAGLAGFENVDQAFPIFITDYLPTGIGIVVILAVMSAILSTTDTRLHSTGVTTARDIYDWYADDASDQQLMKVSRIATIFWGVTATAMAVNPPGTIITLYTFRAILLTSAFLIPIYLGLYWTGVAGNAIIASIVVGTLLGVGWDLSGGFLGVPATFMGVGGAFVALLIGHLVWSDSGGGRTSVAAGD
ncbi:sodium:solute symporter family protein [Salinirubellus sp. GCM10025818]|uniref:sodium:solute symporter family protein n=1 Tax=Salinirubellus TaxID=2162630 RepID=UPI0030D14BD6